MTIVWIGRITEPFKPERPSRPRGPAPVNRAENAHPLETNAGSPTPEADQILRPPPRSPYMETPRKQFKPAKRVAEIMSQTPITVLGQDSSADAWNLMVKRRIRHLPVLDQAGRVIGIISDRDIMRAGTRFEDATRVSVADLMTKKVLAALPEASIRDVAGAMANQRIHCFPIINGSQKLQGIITSSDILHCLVNRDPLDLWI